MSQQLDALRAIARGVSHPLLGELIAQGLATAHPVGLTPAGRSLLQDLEDKLKQWLQAEAAEEDEYRPSGP